MAHSPNLGHDHRMTSIPSLSLIPELKLAISELGFTKLTPIQEQSLPLLLEGKDLIGQSKTGSGKTLAFTLPILNAIPVSDRVFEQPLSALVLCPTRELCAQVAKEIQKLGRKHPGLRVLSVAGGSPMGPQIDALERGIQIVVGTPGRVLDHLNRQTIDLRRIKTLVLDEADRMLEMGFQEEMERILSHLPEKRQTVLFSATFPKTILQLSSEYQQNAVTVKIEEEDTATALIEQSFYETQFDDQQEKLETLLSILAEHQPETAIVFCNMKITVDEIVPYLKHEGVTAEGLHGDLEQSDRDKVMVKLRNKSIRVLVATDVAARGIDITALDLVVNYDIPKQEEIYVHRIGRTGRAGKSGIATSILLPKEKVKLKALEEKTKATISKRETLSIPDRFEMKADMATLYISGGKRDKMRAGDILGALTGEAGGLPGDAIGKIEILPDHSYVAVAKDLAKTAIQRLQSGKIKGRRFRVEFIR